MDPILLDPAQLDPAKLEPGTITPLLKQLDPLKKCVIRQLNPDTVCSQTIRLQSKKVVSPNLQR